MKQEKIDRINTLYHKSRQRFGRSTLSQSVEICEDS